ncbi:PREDICTED: sodium/calcium exchanger 3-like [Rhagoletis zephyria]|uniref:sodium/calcium exchanger 3-like n=1 Tax=Rhagoletis zephyria TaxID=28612 RepID=UPI0008115916|nr:PREDICTED: sodium/calcium exchanger 3-like [Rhagoletis zephyria]
MELYLLGAYTLYCQLGTVLSSHNSTTDHLEPGSISCKPGLLLPVWEPTTNLALGDIIARGVVYFVLLVYMFVGVSIIADKFMAAIEVITSQERTITIKKPNAEPQVISVRVWNETVSNLTLMALGSSAPEILLSIIEVIAQDWHAGDLGPSTIVGSAAFNMFVIIAICVWSVDDYKKIKHLRVFFVTMIWSVFAYIWLCFILTWSSRGVIDIWEGTVTFLMFPATVLTAYIADRRLLIYKYLSKKYRMNKHGVIVGAEGEDVELATAKMNHVNDNGFKVFEETDEEAKEFEEHRREYISVLREIRKKNPSASMAEIEVLARNEIMNRGPKSRAFYRLQATKKLTGGNILSKRRVERVEDEVKTSKKDENLIKIFFNPGHYTVMENVGQFAVTVTREGDLSHSVCVDFKTEDGTAEAGSDYEAVEGTLIFRSGEAHKQVLINVIDDDVFEEDEHFYVLLSNPSNMVKNLPKLQLSTPAVATVMILDDDHSGVFSFADGQYEIAESSGEYQLKVCRFSGARGRVVLPYKTIEGTARDGTEFEMTSGQILFDDNETSQYIPIHIIDNESYEKDATFYVELGEPIREEDLNNEAADTEAQTLTSSDEIALLGKPKLGELYKCAVRIKESKEFKNMVDKLISKANTSIMMGSGSWKEQFIEAITVSAGDEEDDDGEEADRVPSCSDYVMHFFTLFWKLLFAFVPPTDYMNGWLCFITSIVVIGAITAVIGDLASHFGCTSGIKDSVTAISFVALGTSVPDTFASKVAAQNDKYADSSIGNVTGSNAVNVFLGIGIAWTLAAIVRWTRGEQFTIDPGSLTYSVTLFCICAFICCAVLLFRRRRRLGGELGGPLRSRLATTILFVCLWFFYLIMSSLEAYQIIPGF